MTPLPLLLITLFKQKLDDFIIDLSQERDRKKERETQLLKNTHKRRKRKKKLQTEIEREVVLEKYYYYLFTRSSGFGCSKIQSSPSFLNGNVSRS